MKCIPAGILFATLLVTAPPVSRALADESAQQLSEQAFGNSPSLTDESASQLSNQTLGTTPSLQDQSAGNLSKQDLGPNPSMTDESASQLSKQNLGANPNLQDESARKLAEKEDLEKKGQKISSAPQTSNPSSQGDGVDGIIYAVAAQADGSVIIGGRFQSVNGEARMNLARFKPDGTLDEKFLAGPTDGADGTVYALAIDAKGNLLVGGYFSTAQGQPEQNFVRYLSSGTLDTNFIGGQMPNGPVFAVAVLSGDKIVIGGEFTQVGNAPRRNIARFNADGTLDGPVASSNTSTGAVRSLAALPNGGILAGGNFSIAGQTVRNLLSTGAP